MSVIGDIGAVLIAELERMDRMMTTGEWLCPCGPAWVIDDETVWAYSPVNGWHNPHTPHAALWAVA